MHSPIELLSKIDPSETKFHPSTFAIDHMFSVLVSMSSHNLEASRIKITADSISIVWENGFNVGHSAEIICHNDGSVRGKAINEEYTKDWQVSDFAAERQIFFLTLDETLEYIRHFIWANHNL